MNSFSGLDIDFNLDVEIYDLCAQDLQLEQNQGSYTQERSYV